MLMLMGVSCAPRAGAPLPAPPNALALTMKEFTFTHASTVPSGRVVIKYKNAGHLIHRFALLPLPRNLPPIAQQLKGSQPVALSPLAAIPNRSPGGTGAVAVDLPPGRYAFICFVVDEDLMSHASKGMASEFRAVP